MYNNQLLLKPPIYRAGYLAVTLVEEDGLSQPETVSQIHRYIASDCTTCSNKPSWVFGISRPIWNLKLFGIFLDHFLNRSCSSEPAPSCKEQGVLMMCSANLGSHNSELEMTSYSWRQRSNYKSLKVRCRPPLLAALLANIRWLKQTAQ